VPPITTPHAAHPSTRPSHVPTSRTQSLAAQDVFKKVVLVGRRQVELPKGPGYDKMVRASHGLWECVCL